MTALKKVEGRIAIGLPIENEIKHLISFLRNDIERYDTESRIHHLLKSLIMIHDLIDEYEHKIDTVFVVEVE